MLPYRPNTCTAFLELSCWSLLYPIRFGAISTSISRVLTPVAFKYQINRRIGSRAYGGVVCYSSAQAYWPPFPGPHPRLWYT